MSQKRPHGTEEYSGDERQDEKGNGRRRAVRPFGMPESEQRARMRRRARIQSRITKTSSDKPPILAGDQTEAIAEARESGSSQLPTSRVGVQGRKPWESLVVGSLGENLSHIERKNREIEQQKFIVRYHEEHSPNEVDHNRRILDQLIQDRAQMEDNEENNMPEDQREKGERISQRLTLLRWVQINLEFRIQRDKVSSNKRKFSSVQGGKSDGTAGATQKEQAQNHNASCQLGTLLDSGATFPIILESDLARLNMDLSKYPAQGVMEINIVGGRRKLKFYEMLVLIRADDGSSLVGQGDEAVWPQERATLGGFCPVLAQPDPRGSISWTNRLSGMIPFDACYISSAPSLARIWLGEDRRDVLGTNRLPAHLRFDPEKRLIVPYPIEFETLRAAARTPDRVVFLHEPSDKSGSLIIDTDTNVKGRSEIAIGKYQTEGGSPGETSYTRFVPSRVLQFEPRKGGTKTIRKQEATKWRQDFIKSSSPKPASQKTMGIV